ncbi:MAG: hypothetical protein LUE98_11205 [Tannerellaceae bacterium]|nr:hypothetical protein [Tannerellaceae bacterium]
MDNRSDWDDVLLAEEDKEVKSFLIERLTDIKEKELYQEAIIANLFYETSEDRFLSIIKKVENVLTSV